MVNKVVENLYIGDVVDAIDGLCIEEIKRELKITHILTVSTVGIPEAKQIEGICYMFAYAFDLCTQDMFINNLLANSLKYISSNIEDGGSVLVHCESGISRSAFIVAAFLMQKYRWSSLKAVDYIQKIRPVVQLNDGFFIQLQIFESVGFDADIKTVSQCSLYKKWLLINKPLNDAVSKPVHNSSASQSIPTFDLGSTSDLKNTEYRCRKCRNILFDGDHVMRHKIMPVDETMEAVDCDFHYLLLPLNWMNLGDYQGKIFCPSCGEKLGHYIWGGRVCNGVNGKPCGTAVRPWTYVNQNKIDRTLRTNTETAMGMIIYKPVEDQY